MRIREGTVDDDKRQNDERTRRKKIRLIRSCTDGEKTANGKEEENAKKGEREGLLGERRRNTIVFDTPSKTS